MIRRSPQYLIPSLCQPARRSTLRLAALPAGLWETAPACSVKKTSGIIGRCPPKTLTVKISGGWLEHVRIVAAIMRMLGLMSTQLVHKLTNAEEHVQPSSWLLSTGLRPPCLAINDCTASAVASETLTSKARHMKNPPLRQLHHRLKHLIARVLPRNWSQAGRLLCRRGTQRRR